MRRYIPTTTQISYSEFYSNYSGGKRKAYEEAAKSLELYPLQHFDSKIDMFVKCERVDPISKGNPDPRPISARNKRYVLSIGTWLKPLEHSVYRCKYGYPFRIIVKGMNPFQRAALLVKKIARFDDPVVFSLDCSRWDKHVSYELLKLEHSFYNSCCNDPTLARVLSWQLINNCRSRLGTRYKVKGRRMSGDYNTALGNCLLMTAMVINIFKSVAIHHDIMDDGDDCLVIIERDDMPKIKNIAACFLDFGHEIKIENIAHVVEAVVFCQSSPVYDGMYWRFVRNPWKVLSNSTTGFLKLREPKLRRKMLYAIGVCELSLNFGMPILQEFCLKLIKLGQECDVQEVLKYDPNFSDLLYRVRGIPLNPKIAEVTIAARLSFTNAFYVTHTEQLDIEHIIRDWNPDIFDEIELPYDWLVTLRMAADVVLSGY
jgi:hypothetical protein